MLRIGNFISQLSKDQTLKLIDKKTKILIIIIWNLYNNAIPIPFETRPVLIFHKYVHNRKIRTQPHISRSTSVKNEPCMTWWCIHLEMHRCDAVKALKDFNCVYVSIVQCEHRVLQPTAFIAVVRKSKHLYGNKHDPRL